MDAEDSVVAKQDEKPVHLFGSDDGTEAYTSEDPLSDDNSNRKRARHRWFENTKPERDLIREIKVTRRKNLSRILHRAFLIEERRKRELIRRRHLGEIAKEDQSTDEEKNKNLKVGLRSRDFITAWPFRPQDLQPEEYGLHQRSLLIQHTQDKTRNRTTNRALVDLSGLRPNAVPDQKAATSSSNDDDESLSDASLVGPDDIAELIQKLHSFKTEPDPRPSAQMEEILLAHLMRISKENFRKRIRAAQLRANGFDISADDRLMTTQLRPLTRNLITCLNTFLRGMDDQPFGRGKRRLHYNDWKTVMMVASQQGWPKEILERATKRCNAIFKAGLQPEKTTEKSPVQVQSLSTKTRHFCSVKTCVRNRIPFAQLPNLKQHMDRNHPGNLT